MNSYSDAKNNSEVSFTSRELEILKLLAAGCTNREIGAKLYFSHHTIKAELEKIYNKTGCQNRVQVVIYALKNNIIDCKSADGCI